MSRFAYRVKDSQGISIKGIVEASTLKQASFLLHERGYYIIDLKEDVQSAIQLSFSNVKMGFNDLVHFTRQLATMITAGLTLVEALGILKQQLKKKSVLNLVDLIERDIQGGKSFAEVLERYPRIFSPLYLALVKAGEASGKLDVILSRLADTLEKSRDFRNKVRGAMIYPSIIVGGMTIVAVVVMVVVIPRLSSLYKEFGTELPLPTQILIAVSMFFVKFWWVLVVAIICIMPTLIKFSQSNTGRHLLGFLSINLPVFGGLVKEMTLVELTRTLSILIGGGVPILTALEISRDATGNILFKEAFAEAQKKVEKGYPLSFPLSECTLFPPILGQMVAVGEQTGKLDESLFKLSHYFEEEADNAVHSLTTMIEPLIMIVLGLGVGFLVLAVLLPIYSLTSKF